MKFTKKQQERLVLLKTENIYNPIRLRDTDVFTKFEIGNLFEKPRKTGNWITVRAETKPHNHETLSDYTNYFFTKEWQIFISPRGKMFAPMYPEYLEGRKKTHCGQITLGNIEY
jgi:hypothetical protein